MENIMINPLLKNNINDSSSYATIRRLGRVGRNTGNLLFVESCKRQFVYSQECWFEKDQNYSSDIHAIFPASNFLSASTYWLEDLVDILKTNNLLFTLVGVGAQANLNEVPKEVVRRMSNKQQDFFRIASERTKTIGVRGEFSAECLELMGIHNIRIIGCPAVFENIDVYKNMLPKPDKIVYNITPGKAAATKILEIVRELPNAKWIMQSEEELPRTITEDCVLETRHVQKAFPKWNVTTEWCRKYMKENAHIFWDLTEWEKFLKAAQFTFSLGMRFHGNLVAFRCGIPSLWIVHDMRIKELVDYLKLPHIFDNDLLQIQYIEQLVDRCNYSVFESNIDKAKYEYELFLKENSIIKK